MNKTKVKRKELTFKSEDESRPLRSNEAESGYDPEVTGCDKEESLSFSWLSRTIKPKVGTMKLLPEFSDYRREGYEKIMSHSPNCQSTQIRKCRPLLGHIQKSLEAFCASFSSGIKAMNQSHGWPKSTAKTASSGQWTKAAAAAWMPH